MSVLAIFRNGFTLNHSTNFLVNGQYYDLVSFDTQQFSLLVVMINQKNL